MRTVIEVAAGTTGASILLCTLLVAIEQSVQYRNYWPVACIASVAFGSLLLSASYWIGQSK